MKRRRFVQLAAAGAAGLIVAPLVMEAHGQAQEGAAATPSPTLEGLLMVYEVKTALRPAGLTGISENQIAQHWKLHEGYVTNTNALLEELRALRKEGKGGTPSYSDRRRRLGFEYNGMALHEYYFSNLKANVAEPDEQSPFRVALSEQFDSFDAFKEDFARTGMSRSIGWAILYLDPATGTLNNHFVQLHEDGNISSFAPILIMDVWEHAYMADYGASGRGEYIKAFFNNINWRTVEQRFADAKSGKISGRWLQQ